ncbi:MAG: hypothetical protein IKG18_17500 [Atopobiaceae bacterium]|nr:hypothetical protein [Atopobiaceae bacterium]
MSYRSGFEAYCKEAAALIISDHNPGQRDWLEFCKEILPSRTLKNVGKAWTLSNGRKGPGNRLSLFEKDWLKGYCYTDFQDDAIAFFKWTNEHDVDEKPPIWRTIDRDGRYQQDLLSCKNLEECKTRARKRCEEAAIRLCVEDLMRKITAHDEGREPFIQLLGESEGFAIKFDSVILPRIEEGFLSERYSQTDLLQFRYAICDYLGEAYACLRKENPSKESLNRLKSFLIILVAGLIYGPGHHMTVGRPGEKTADYSVGQGSQSFELTNIRVTQVFDEASSAEGISAVFKPDQVVFLGRSVQLIDYLEKCEETLEDDTLETVEARKAEIFRIDKSHESVSNAHGMLLNENEVWRYYDLHSHNGSSLQTETDTQDASHVVTLLPADRIRLGASTSVDDINQYWNAAVLRVASYVTPED